MAKWYLVLMIGLCYSGPGWSKGEGEPPRTSKRESADGRKVRLIHHPRWRPDRLVELSSLFGEVQPVAFTTRIAPAVAAAPWSPTVVVVRDGVSRSNAEWYRALYGVPDVVVLHFGKRPLRGDLPASWTVVRCCGAGQLDAAAVAVQRLLGTTGLTQASPRRKGTKRHRPSSS